MSGSMDASVVLHLVDKVSPALAHIASGMAKTTTAAARLQAQMSKIHSTFGTGLMQMGAGMALAAPIIAATQAAEKYQHQINLMNTAGLTSKELAEATAAAWKTAGSVLGSTATGNLEITSDLKTVFGNMREAIALTPKMSKMGVALGAVLESHGTGGALQRREQNYAAAKSADMLGKVSSPEEYGRTMDDMYKVSVASQGRVLPSDYQNTFKYAKLARYGWSDDYRNKIMPELMLESKGKAGGTQTVGTQNMALYRFGVQGVMNKKSAELLQGLGMADVAKSLKTTTTGTTLHGGVKGSELLAKNPFEWVQTIFKPALMKKYGLAANDNDALVQKSNQIFKSNAGAGNIVAEFLKKPMQYQRFGKLYDKADNVDQAYARGMKNDPQMNKDALKGAWNNLKTTLGTVAIPVIIPMINKLATGINNAAMMFHDHPALAKAAVSTLALASAALTLNGAMNIAKAGMLGAKLLGGSALGSPAVGALVKVGIKLAGVCSGALSGGFINVLALVSKFALGLTLAGVAITAVILVVQNWDKIMKFVHDNAGFFLVQASKLANMIDYLGKVFNICSSFATTFASSLLTSMGSLPFIGDMAKNIQASMKTSAADQAAAEANLRSKGYGGLADSIKGSSPAEMAKGSKPGASNSASQKNSTTVVQHNNIVVQQVPGHDHEKCAATMNKKLALAASASSGSSVGRSNNIHGHHRS